MIEITFYLTPVDGGYSAFGDWSECSAECDGGTQTRTRQCNDPAPINGGKECEGGDSETKNCNEDPCPGNFVIELDSSDFL